MTTGGPPPAGRGRGKELHAATVSEIGARKLASGVIGTIKDAVEKEMDAMRLEVGAGVAELVAEINDGTKQVVRVLQDEAAGVRAELSEIVGNAQAAADDAVKQAADAADERPR